MTDSAATSTHSQSNGGRRSSPTRDQMAAWRAFLRAHASITRALEVELLAEQDLPLASYDVLVQLAEAPDRRLRMTELADAVVLASGGYGFVERVLDEPVPAGGERLAPQRLGAHRDLLQRHHVSSET